MTFSTIGQVLNAPEAVKKKVREANRERPTVRDERGDFVQAPRTARASYSALAERRTGQPVRRHSHRADRISPAYSCKITRRDAWEIVAAAEKYDDAGRAKGGKRPLGPAAIKVLRYLANLAAYSGRVEPSYDYLAEKLALSRATIASAIKSLKLHRFLDWVRRYVPTGERSGPQVKQTSNAYRLSLPAVAKQLLGRLSRRSPLPDDVVQAARDRVAEVEAMRAHLSVPEQITLDFGADDPIGQVLGRLWQSMQERESKKLSELES